ncbi:hypothetical protein [Halorussus amylolyticus]|nr:hypothetical protein [Halorussus amylolyticus]
MDTLTLRLEGVSRDDVTTEFLTNVLDVAEEHGLSADGVSVRRSTGPEE